MAMLLLAREALGQADYDYLHVRSGQDYPIRTADAIDQFFAANRGREFAVTFPIPNTRWWGEEGGYDRICRFRLHTYLDVKRRHRFGPDMEKLEENVWKAQRRLGIWRKMPSGLPRLHGGSQWVSCTRGYWKNLLEQWDSHGDWYRFFRFSFCAEEFVLPTFAHSFSEQVDGRVVNHVDWTRRNGSFPAILDDSDFERIRNSGHLFVRKVEYPVSRGLLDRIDRELLGR
jgi:hypothetical protein